MERWENLLIRVVPYAGGHGKQYVIEPKQWDLQANMDNVSDSGTVALLDELGAAGWQVVTADLDQTQFLLKRRTEPQEEPVDVERTIY